MRFVGGEPQCEIEVSSEIGACARSTGSTSVAAK